MDDEVIEKRRQQRSREQAGEHQPTDIRTVHPAARSGDDLAHQRQVVDVAEPDI